MPEKTILEYDVDTENYKEIKTRYEKLDAPIRFESSDFNALKCPVCDFYYMHQEKLDIHFRPEDAKNLPGYHVNRDGIKAPAELPNPSFRRDGLVITFSCEQCSSTENPKENFYVCLAILQHKGNTFFEWYALTIEWKWKTNEELEQECAE